MLSRPNEQLEDHIRSVLENYNKLNVKNRIEKVLYNIFGELINSDEIKICDRNFCKDLIYNILKFHDEGKRNKYFQSYVDSTKNDIKYNDERKEHSIISSYYFLEYYISKINKNIKQLKGKDKIKTGGKLKVLILACAYVISKHHGDLLSFDSDILLQNISSKYQRMPDVFFDGFNSDVIGYYKRNYKLESDYQLYIFIKLIYSILITCDFLAVYEFNQSKKLNLNIIDNTKINQFKSDFENTNIIKSIRSPNNKNMLEVNKYRTEMFLESEKTLKDIDSMMYYLEAPTGSGKSITSLNLALKLINDECNKIYYVAPFINIIEQTYKDIKEILGNKDNKDIVLINSKEEIALSNNEENDDMIYEKDYLDNQLVNYPISIISHVKLFDILFSNKRKHNLMLPLLCNSVIILDEIQSYKNNLWIDIINMLKEYSEALNIKIIIMSATLPKLDLLLDDKRYAIQNLISNRKYYFDFFKTRCRYNFSLLGKGKGKEILYNKVNQVINEGSRHRILIGLISVKTCDMVFDEMKKYKSQGFKVFKITGATNSAKRKYIVNKLKEKDENGQYKLEKVILVATQCIEAGIDIDMSIGFKNISILDSDEQFAGRIERNFINQGIVYYFRIDDLGLIYKDDYRAERTLLSKEWREVLENKKFDIFYERNYKWLLEKEYDKHIQLKKYISDLKFNVVYEHLKLIKDNLKVDIIMEINYLNEDGSIVEFQQLEIEKNKLKTDSNMGYGKRQILLKKLRVEYNLLTYCVNIYDIDKIKNLYEKDGVHYIKNPKDFFENLTDGMLTCKSELNINSLIKHTL